MTTNRWHRRSPIHGTTEDGGQREVRERPVPLRPVGGSLIRNERAPGVVAPGARPLPMRLKLDNVALAPMSIPCHAMPSRTLPYPTLPNLAMPGPKQFKPLREVVWVILTHFQKPVFSCCCRCGACGQRACVVHHVHSDVSGTGVLDRGKEDSVPGGEVTPGECDEGSWEGGAGRYRGGSMQVRILSRR